MSIVSCLFLMCQNCFPSSTFFTMRIALCNMASTIPATCKDTFSHLSCTLMKELQLGTQVILVYGGSKDYKYVFMPLHVWFICYGVVKGRKHTVKTPPMIAHKLVMKWENDLRASLTNTCIGEQISEFDPGYYVKRI